MEPFTAFHMLGGKIFCMNLRDWFSDSGSIEWRYTFKKPKFNTNQMEESLWAVTVYFITTQGWHAANFPSEALVVVTELLIK